MNGDTMFDEIARILASPMPRRQVLRRIIGGLAGAALASVAGSGRVLAAPKTCTTDSDCGSGSFCCNKKICCPAGQLCCSSGAVSQCCPAGGSCCGSGNNMICCDPGEVCGGNGGHPTCTQASPR